MGVVAEVAEKWLTSGLKAWQAMMSSSLQLVVINTFLTLA